jgi:hypothetical protein
VGGLDGPPTLRCCLRLEDGQRGGELLGGFAGPQHECSHHHGIDEALASGPVFLSHNLDDPYAALCLMDVHNLQGVAVRRGMLLSNQGCRGAGKRQGCTVRGSTDTRGDGADAEAVRAEKAARAEVRFLLLKLRVGGASGTLLRSKPSTEDGETTRSILSRIRCAVRSSRCWRPKRKMAAWSAGRSMYF